MTPHQLLQQDFCRCENEMLPHACIALPRFHDGRCLTIRADGQGPDVSGLHMNINLKNSLYFQVDKAVVSATEQHDPDRLRAGVHCRGAAGSWQRDPAFVRAILCYVHCEYLFYFL